MTQIEHKGKRYKILGPHARLGRDGVVRDHNGEPLKGKFVSADRAATWAAAEKPKASKRTKKGGK